MGCVVSLLIPEQDNLEQQPSIFQTALANSVEANRMWQREQYNGHWLDQLGRENLEQQSRDASRTHWRRNCELVDE